MTAISSSTYSARQDPEFRQAMEYFHRGRWKQAIALLQPLHQRHPHDAAIAQALQEAEFKLKLDATAKVRAKRWIIPWRRITLAVGFVAAALVLVYAGSAILRQGIRPMLAQAAEQRSQARMLADAGAFLAAGDLDAAERLYAELLAVLPAGAPQRAEIDAALALIADERTLATAYDAALASEEAGEHASALQAYTELQLARPGYRDISQHITRLRRYQEIDALLTEADTLQQLAMPDLAAQRYEQARTLDLSYRSGEVTPALVALYDRLARRIVEADPAQPNRLEEAVALWNKALDLDGHNKPILEERRIARFFLEGKTFAAQANWSYAVNRFQSIFDERPTYLGGAVALPLYDAYLASGDGYRDAGDCTLAYDQYARAARLPVADPAVALARMSQAQPCLTPTPTPAPTEPPTTPLPTPAPNTPTPTATPYTLLAFRGQILFTSDSPDQPGLWVMDATGANRRFLGEVDTYAQQLDALRQAATFSPDRTLKVFVSDLDGKSQIWIDYTAHPQFKSRGLMALTRMTGIAYDPAWSPDGGSIVYVTQENESDDIWLMDADGDNQRALMRNDWEWDKSPSWSPDSRRIVFWSNRNGLKQLYLMDTNGKVLQNLSSAAWDEYDPVWVK